jgi:hypothetical protein
MFDRLRPPNVIDHFVKKASSDPLGWSFLMSQPTNFSSDWICVFILEVPGKDVALPRIDILNSSDPLAFAARLIPTARALYYAKILGDQFVWAELIFLHVCFTVGAML